jgi:hypothetical protein
MAYYALITRREGSVEPWKPCAFLISGEQEGAARQAKALRVGGGIAFVPNPSRFRIRRATRTEVSLMMGFFRSVGAPSDAFASDHDLDAAFARRERLLRAFFLGLYIDPDAMRRRYAPFAPDTTGGGSGASGGGGESTGLDSVGLSPEPSVEEVSQGAVESLGDVDGGGILLAGEAATGDDGPLGSENQENALAAILNSAEANDGGKGREESFDLDIL